MELEENEDDNVDDHNDNVDDHNVDDDRGIKIIADTSDAITEDTERDKIPRKRKLVTFKVIIFMKAILDVLKMLFCV